MPAKKGYKKNNKRKNNRRGARKTNNYNSSRKVNVLKMLQPIVENRKYELESSQAVTLTGQYNITIPDVWEKMQRSDEWQTQDRQLTQQGFTGTTLYSKYLNLQSIVEFDSINHINVPVRISVIQGWFKTPYLTEAQSSGNNPTNAQGVLHSVNMSTFIGNQLQGMLQGRFSNLDKKRVVIKFQKEYDVRGVSIETEDGAGGIDVTTERKPLKHYFTWKPNRKYHMRPATSISEELSYATVKPDDPNAFWTPSSTKNNDLWVPFVFHRFYNSGDFGHTKTVDETTGQYTLDANLNPKLWLKQAHYFTDI